MSGLEPEERVLAETEGIEEWHDDTDKPVREARHFIEHKEPVRHLSSKAETVAECAEFGAAVAKMYEDGYYADDMLNEMQALIESRLKAIENEGASGLLVSSTISKWENELAKIDVFFRGEIPTEPFGHDQG